MRTRRTLRVLSVFVFVQATFFSFAQKQNPLQTVKQYVQQHANRLKVSPKNADNLEITYEYTDASTGIQHIYSTQKLNGLAITGSNFSLHLSGDKKTEANRLIATEHYKTLPVNVSVSAADAVKKLMDAIAYGAERQIEIKQAASGAERYTIFKRNNSSVWDIPCRLVYFNNQRLKTLIPAWEVQMMDVNKKHYWLAYVDAAAGIILQKKDLIIHCDFGGGITDANNGAASSVTITENTSSNEKLAFTFNHQFLPPANNQYRVYDLPYESPIDPGAAHTLVTNGGDALASPDGWHKIGNLAGVPYTKGNNVWAFYDPSPGPLGGVPSLSNTAVTSDVSLVEPFKFDYPINLANEPETYRNAAIVNLFYWNNLMHDVFYYMGFDEASRNFESSHTFSSGTRGGATALANDEVWAQAQDGGGTNNANFLTLPDGINGQMQMYLWTGSFADDIVQITSSTSGTPPGGEKYSAIQGSFSTVPIANTNLYTNPVVNKQFAIVQANALSTVGSSSEGCTTGQQSVALPSENVNGKIALIDRGTCSFAEKVLGAQLGGAVGAIIINNIPGPPLAMGGTDAPGNAITIPAVMISKEDGDILKAQIQSGATIVGSLKRDNPPPPKRDGDIDNGVIAHEYGHGISNRLTGGGEPLPLGGDEQGGEGWSDFVALYMTLRSNDLLTPTTAHPNGVLPNRSIGNYVTYQNYDGRGIREYPYSSDMSVNPATFAYIKRPDYSETHSVGFVWCTMLYELLQSFVDQYGMNDNVYEGATPVSQNPPASAKGNNIATRLVIEAMKLQPVSPTFIEERDAILKADTLLYNAQHSCLIWKAFAKRGLGYSASSGTNGLGDEAESFDLPFSCDPSQKRIRIAKSGPIKMKNKSEIKYTITVTNVLPSNIQSVIITDTLASSLTLNSATRNPVVNGQILTWDLSLDANTSKTIVVKAQLNSNGTSHQKFSDDQEDATNGKWSAESSATAMWQHQTDSSQAFSGEGYWFVTDYDLGGSNTSLRTVNAKHIKPSCELIFIHKYAAEDTYDGGVVEISTDGTNWEYLPPNKFVRGGYSGIIPTANNPYIGTSDAAAFTGVSDGYIVSIASLEDYVGQDIYFRFRMTSDVAGGSIEGGGWWIDNVYILRNRKELSNRATAITTENAAITENEGTNAYAETSGFIVGKQIQQNFALNAKAEKQTVDLDWVALEETDADEFEIERKAPGDADFKKIAVVSADDYDEDDEYSYTDKHAVHGESQYRVKQVSRNSQSKYTNIAAVKIGMEAFRAQVFPNPAQSSANLSVDNPEGRNVTINLFDNNGKKLATFNGGKGTKQLISLPVQQLPAGTYWIEVRTDEKSVTLQLVVKR